MAFDLPRGRVLRVDAIDVRLDPQPHPFVLDNAVAIQANWAREVAEKPALFDGEVVLLSELGWRDKRLSGRCHVVGFSTFMFWRRSRAATAEHCFAHAALVSSDNALVAIRMGAHTVNAGRVYFAAGSFEPQDFRDGRVDADFNMAREVVEETGLAIGGLRRDEAYHLYSHASGTVIFRRYYLAETADEIAARVTSFVAIEEEPEISGPVIIRAPGDFAAELMPHMAAIVEWHFAGGSD